MASGVGRLAARHLAVGAAQLQGVPRHPGGLWVPTQPVSAAYSNESIGTNTDRESRAA